MIKKIIKNIMMPEYNAVILCRKIMASNNKSYYRGLWMRSILLKRYSIHFGLNSVIGENLKFPHPLSIVIGDGVRIGDNCTIFHNVTMGLSHKNGEIDDGYPTIGNNVTIFTGSLILGNIEIGDNVIIGANSVVTRDLEANAIYAGNPAKKISSFN